MIRAFEHGLSWINRRPRLGLTVLAVFMAAQISPWFYPTVDGCLYLKTVREFLASDRISEFHCLVPPGYPLLIAPAFLFGDRPFLAVSILQWLTSIGLMWGVYVWARRQFPAGALLLTAAVMLNISVWTFYRRPLKEVATMALIMWIVNLMHGLLDEKRLVRIVLLTLATGLLTAYLTLMRYSAVTLPLGFAAAAGVLAWRGSLSWTRAAAMSAVIGVCAGATLACWLEYDRRYGAGGVYLHEFTRADSDAGSATASDGANRAGEVDGLTASEAGGRGASSSNEGAGAFHAYVARAQRSLHGALYRVNDIGCLIVPGLWKSTVSVHGRFNATEVLFLALLGVMAAGWVRIVRFRLDVLALTVPIYFLIYTQWICDQPGGRFMLPMLPVLAACVWSGLASIGRHRAAIFGILVLAHLAQSTTYWLWIDAPRAYRIHQNWPAVDRLATRIRECPGTIAVSDQLLSACNGLWLELDWACRLQSLDLPIGPAVTWIIEPIGSRPADGFSVRAIEGPFQLLARTAALPAASDGPLAAGRPRQSGSPLAQNL